MTQAHAAATRQTALRTSDAFAVEPAIRVGQMEGLVDVAQHLSLARNLERVMQIVRKAARELTGADGATFVLRRGNHCYYADEDAIAPLWKGRSFPLESCISGWVMIHREPAVIDDIYADVRIPADAYRPTFVKSLAMVPIRTAAPIGAIGNYWATRRQPAVAEVKLLQSLADLTSVAMENVQLYGELERAIQARDEFLSIVSHELRTPLTAVHLQLQGLLELIGRSDLDGQSLATRIGRATIGTKRLGGLIDRLLDVSRIELGRFTTSVESFDLAELVRDVIARRHEEASSAGCEVRLAAPESVSGRWDRLRIEQMLDHLLSNALRFGAGKPVEVLVERTGAQVRIQVSDQGPGISPDGVARLFQRFGRAAPLQHFGGLGLGLYICRKIVEAHQGTLGVVTELGKGSLFTVELPLEPESRVADDASDDRSGG